MLRYRDESGVQRLSIIKRASHKWKVITDRLSSDPNKAKTLSQQYNNNPSECLRQVFVDCFINNKPANDYSQDWSGIVELLEDVEEEQIATEVRDMLARCKNIKVK